MSEKCLENHPSNCLRNGRRCYNDYLQEMTLVASNCKNRAQNTCSFIAKYSHKLSWTSHQCNATYFYFCKRKKEKKCVVFYLFPSTNPLCPTNEIMQYKVILANRLTLVRTYTEILPNTLRIHPMITYRIS